LDREKRRLYDMGGWTAVEQHTQMQQARSSRNMKCEAVNLNLEVTLEQVYRQETVPIKVTLPGNSGEFAMDLKIDPGMLGNGICVEHKGISRPDCITGDVIIRVNLDKKRTPFKVQGLDIILEVKMSLADLLGYTIQIDHPSGTTYSISGKYENSDKNNDNMIKYYPTMGLTSGSQTGAMIICIIPDFTNLSKLPKKIVHDIQALLASYRKYTPDTVSHKAIDITEKSAMPPRPRGSGFQMMSSMNGVPVQIPPPIGMEGNPMECPVS
jgi:DnaJ-class molecular chaperone